MQVCVLFTPCMYVTSADPNTDTSGVSPFTPKDVASGYHCKDPLGSDQSVEEEAGGNADELSVCFCVYYKASWANPSLAQPALVTTPLPNESRQSKHRLITEPQDSGCKVTKHVRHTGVDALYALSEAVVKSMPALPPGGLTSPECMTEAISLVEGEEEDMGTEAMMQAVELFQWDKALNRYQVSRVLP